MHDGPDATPEPGLFDDQPSGGTDAAETTADAQGAVAETVVVYTDGACSGNPGPGGWAWAVAPEGAPRGCGAEAHTTNQRMEVLATLRAVEHFADDPRTLRIVSDSTYVVKCFNEKWWQGWLRRDWRNSQRQPVANRDLWEPLIDLVLRRGNVQFEWVKGHSGDPMNDLVDALAVSESRRAGGDG